MGLNDCGACGAKEGQIHNACCDMERCPLCGEQLLFCGCKIKEKDRIPHILYPIICARCGKLWPEMFMVSDEEWEKYIQADKRKCVLCKTCYEGIKLLIER